MNKKSVVILLIVFLGIALGGMMVYNVMNKPKSVPVPEPIVTAEVKLQEVEVEKPAAAVEETALVVAEVKPIAPPAETVREKRYRDKTTWEGNKGYIIRDGVYVYFGTYTTVKEEITE